MSLHNYLYHFTSRRRFRHLKHESRILAPHSRVVLLGDLGRYLILKHVLIHLSLALIHTWLVSPKSDPTTEHSEISPMNSAAYPSTAGDTRTTDELVLLTACVKPHCGYRVTSLLHITVIVRDFPYLLAATAKSIQRAIERRAVRAAKKVHVPRLSKSTITCDCSELQAPCTDHTIYCCSDVQCCVCRRLMTGALFKRKRNPAAPTLPEISHYIHMYR